MILRGISICLVVLAHSALGTISLVHTQINSISPSSFPLEFTIIIVTKSLSAFGLPTFLFASGFMLYRMHTSWKSTWNATLQILKKYLIWAIPLFLFLSLKNGKFDLEWIVMGLITGGPMPAYWYLILISIIYLISPLWIYGVKSHFRTTLLLVICLQLLSYVLFYGGYNFTISPIIKKLLINPLIFSPPFAAGIFFSRYSGNLIQVINKHRSSLSSFTLLSIFLCLGESVLFGSLNNWSIAGLTRGFAAERFSLTLLFLTGTLWIVSLSGKNSDMSTWLANTGLASFGILLMMDICNYILQSIFWHIPNLISAFAIADIQNWSLSMITGTMTFTLPLYFINGLVVPLFIMKYAKRLLGKRVRYLW
jgi:surface polysaccharide O-acyltransferase-like enzyme